MLCVHFSRLGDEEIAAVRPPRRSHRAACSISSASSTSARAGTMAFARAPPGWPGAWASTSAPRAKRAIQRRTRALEVPRLKQALARGELSYAKGRAARVATPATEELLAVGRAGTASTSSASSAAGVGWIVRRRSKRARQRHESIGRFMCIKDDDGSVVIRGRLAPETGAMLIQALNAACDVQRASRPSQQSRPRTMFLEKRAHEQQQADALVLVRRRRSTMASIPASRVSAIKWWFTWTPRCWPTLNSGQSVIEGGGRVSAETSQHSLATRAEWRCVTMPMASS